MAFILTSVKNLHTNGIEGFLQGEMVSRPVKHAAIDFNVIRNPLLVISRDARCKFQHLLTECCRFEHFDPFASPRNPCGNFVE